MSDELRVLVCHSQASLEAEEGSDVGGFGGEPWDHALGQRVERLDDDVDMSTTATRLPGGDRQAVYQDGGADYPAAGMHKVPLLLADRVIPAAPAQQVLVKGR